jgi:putative tryptophan/tyrosine transport system substrate-binding protein
VALVAAATTKTIPIVFLVWAEPVEEGLVKTFPRPGGNTTGVASLAKRIETLHTAVPTATEIAYLTNPAAK